METDARLLRSVPLENGLTVFFHGLAKKLPAGRCQLQLIITIPIVIKDAYFEGHADGIAAGEMFRNAMVEGLSFRQEKTRNFAPQEEADGILDAMCEDFIRINRAYLSKPDFGKKSVLKKYSEWKESEAIRRAREQALRDND